MAERRAGARGSSTRVALVTGANRGIGLAVAAGLAERGFRVLLSARDREAAERAAAVLRSQELAVTPVTLDITSNSSAEALVRRVRETEGRLDVLINNAGAHYDTEQDVLSADLGVVQAALETNLLGAWRTIQAFVPLMRHHRYGRIVNVSSGAGAFNEAGTGTPAYRVSKAALNMLTVTLAAELAGEPILVNATCPGWVRTDMGWRRGAALAGAGCRYADLAGDAPGWGAEWRLLPRPAAYPLVATSRGRTELCGVS